MLPSEQGTDSVTQPPEKEEKKEKKLAEMLSDIYFFNLDVCSRVVK